MSTDTSKLREKFAELDDEELAEILSSDSDEYAAEALAAAHEEAKRRGGAESVVRKVEYARELLAQMEEIESEQPFVRYSFVQPDAAKRSAPKCDGCGREGGKRDLRFWATASELPVGTEKVSYRDFRELITAFCGECIERERKEGGRGPPGGSLAGCSGWSRAQSFSFLSSWTPSMSSMR